MVSICLLVKDNYWLTRYSIENMLKNSNGVEVELLVLDNGSQDKRIIGFLESLIESKIYSNLMTVGVIEEPSDIGREGYKKLFNEIKGDYLCCFDDNILVNENWLVDLVYYHYNVQGCGYASIFSNGDKGMFTAILSTGDEFINVWQNKQNEVNGVVLFKPEMIDLFLSEDHNKAQSKYQNFYIPTQNSTKIKQNV